MKFASYTYKFIDLLVNYRMQCCSQWIHSDKHWYDRAHQEKNPWHVEGDWTRQDCEAQPKLEGVTFIPRLNPTSIDKSQQSFPQPPPMVISICVTLVGSPMLHGPHPSLIAQSVVACQLGVANTCHVTILCNLHPLHQVPNTLHILSLLHSSRSVGLCISLLTIQNIAPLIKAKVINMY